MAWPCLENAITQYPRLIRLLHITWDVGYNSMLSREKCVPSAVFALGLRVGLQLCTCTAWRKNTCNPRTKQPVMQLLNQRATAAFGHVETLTCQFLAFAWAIPGPQTYAEQICLTDKGQLLDNQWGKRILQYCSMSIWHRRCCRQICPDRRSVLSEHGHWKPARKESPQTAENDSSTSHNSKAFKADNTLINKNSLLECCDPLWAVCDAGKRACHYLYDQLQKGNCHDICVSVCPAHKQSRSATSQGQKGAFPPVRCYAMLLSLRWLLDIAATCMLETRCLWEGCPKQGSIVLFRASPGAVPGHIELARKPGQHASEAEETDSSNWYKDLEGQLDIPLRCWLHEHGQVNSVLESYGL